MLLELCKKYQTFFPKGNQTASLLYNLHASDRTQFMEAYFKHEVEKGREYIRRFEPFQVDWKSSRILDFGCGAGGMSRFLGGLFREVEGFDIQADKIAEGNQFLVKQGVTNVTLHTYDGANIPRPDSSFDFAFCVDVLEHVSSPLESLKEIRRILKPGGRIYLSFGPPWMHPHGKHMWEALPGWWTHLLFPRSVVMAARGFDPATTWSEIGLNRLTISKFEAALKSAGFRTLYSDYRLKSALKPLKWIPGIRELFIAEVVAILEKPAGN